MSKIGLHDTVSPKDVPEKMTELLAWYEEQEVTLEVLAKFHARYEAIHPFLVGNGRTGRIILFRECLVHGIIPVILEDDHRMEYIEGLTMYRNTGSVDTLVRLFEKEQEVYRKKVEKFIL